MSPHIGTGAGEGDNAFGRSQDPGGLSVWRRDPARTPFGVSRSPAGLSLWADVPRPATEGWAVYTFKGDSEFIVIPGAVIRADIMLIGGGGSGGGGYFGGGGGAGGMIDKHGCLIYSHQSGAPHDFAYPDGEIVVGAGGAVVPSGSLIGHRGEDSQFGENLIAYGGGFGGSIGRNGNYPAGSGGSGGGANGFGIWDEGQDPEANPQLYHGIKGEALHNASVPPDDPGDGKDYEQGHDGGQGQETVGWGYNHSAGGGGGAQWPAYGHGYGQNGGLGRCCGIAGLYQCLDPVMNELYRELGWPYMAWFGGGGAGAERPNLWSYVSGDPGFGGGGAVGLEGQAYKGGGGGGNGWLGLGQEGGMAPGGGGGAGVVIVRIPIVSKQFVTSPVIAGGGTWPDHVTYHELGPDEPHLDTPGEEIITIYGWPNQNEYELQHFHSWDDWYTTGNVEIITG